jgi:topoisomerase-4 subunit A
MRLRSLRKLEEMQLRQEKDDLLKEQGELEALLADPAKQKRRLKRDLKTLQKDYAKTTDLGARRTTIAEAAPTVEFSMDAMIEKEPITVIMSQRGWIRAAKGHVDLTQEWKFKEGDELAFVFHAQTTDKLLIATDDGRFFTLGADKLPGARGFGEPVRTTLDIDNAAHIVAAWAHTPGERLLLASTPGKGFVIKSDDLLAETRKGRAVMTLKGDARLAKVAHIGEGHDHVAVVGDNRKLVVFNLEEMPEMQRGQGVQLQRYRDGGMADVTTFRLEDGLSWQMGGTGERTRTEPEMWQWKVARGGAGRMPPNGFPRDNRF